MTNDLDRMAIEYHQYPTPGKVSVAPTKRLANQLDLSLAYSPGVAAACKLIEEDPAQAANMTSRGNLVAVISNGSAVLGLGNIGALAGKPVMEGKAVLFKKFAGIDCFDIEVDCSDPDKMVEIVAALEPTFGGINLEDIKAPECFIIEQKCRERMNIPVFHDDQHGTAICVAAAVYNGLRLVDKKVEDVRVVCSGAGAAAQACVAQLISLGIKPENIAMCDRRGVIYKGRGEGMDEFKERFAIDTPHRTLDDAITGADVFLGVSGPGAMNGEQCKRMAAKPLILALANPTPEITPEEVKGARDDAIMATGRSDYPNQVNNVLCFPFLFRGALDTGATTINEEMKLAAVKAIADLAMAEASDVVASAYAGEALQFGPEYIIPKPFDPRLIVAVSAAVARAAMDSGVATRPLADMKAYERQLNERVYRTGFAMKPLFDRAQEAPKRVVYAEGEEERVLRAVQIVVDDGLAKPVLVGREDVIKHQIEKMGLRLEVGKSVEVIEQANNDKHDAYATAYHEMMARKGVSPQTARLHLRTRSSLLGAMMVQQGDADALICGTVGRFDWHLDYVRSVIALGDGVSDASALQLLIADDTTVFMADTAVTYDPSAQEIAEMTVLSAAWVRRFGFEPHIALVSHSDFGTSDAPSALKMRQALALLKEQAPDLMVDGEMKADSALSEHVRDRSHPGSTLEGTANLLIMPNQDAANIGFNLARTISHGIAVGPMLIGMSKPAHIVHNSISVRGLVNMTAVAVIDAQEQLV
ncbi:MAG: NADP-dependent malic enzyme [Alphaproteobacteria bacterium]